MVAEIMQKNHFEVSDNEKFSKIVSLVKERCTLLTDFVEQAGFFYKTPGEMDLTAVRAKWSEKKTLFFVELIRLWELSILWEHDDLESSFKELAAASQLKPGELMAPLRLMLVGGKFGPGVFDIAALIGKEETLQRIKNVLTQLGN